VVVDEWQALETCILGFVHPGGAGDIAASAAREEFLSHRSVHVLVVSALSSSPLHPQVHETHQRLLLLNSAKYPPAPLIVAVNHCSDLDMGRELQTTLAASGVVVDVVCINSSSGLGLPELEQLRNRYFLWSACVSFFFFFFCLKDESCMLVRELVWWPLLLPSLFVCCIEPCKDRFSATVQF
jgi:hypothetical protein